MNIPTPQMMKMSANTLNLSSLVEKISDRELELLSRDNPDARLETNSLGQLIFMPPTGGETGDRLHLNLYYPLFFSNFNL